MDRLFEWSTDLLTDAYRRGTTTPIAVAEAVLGRIAAWEPAINALYRCDRDAVMAAAREAAQRWRERRPLSALDGVPITIKENIHTRGDPTPIGTAVGNQAVQERDAPPAARAREAGCVIVGKTTMPDYGMLSSGLSSLHGLTRNPWRLDRNTSGSSSGAGAACAAGYGPLHIGTDIGGSVRLPATHCGIVALKPSLGRIPIDPPYLGRAAGPMTRTVRDAAALLTVLSQPDVRDFMSLPYQPVDYLAGVEGLGARGLRIGLITELGVGLAVDTEVRAAAEAAAAALAAGGAVVEPARPFLTPAMLDGVCRFFEARSYNDVSALDESQRARLLPFIVEWCTWRARDFSGRDVMAAYNQVMAMREAATRTASGYDFLLMPTSPILPYEAELAAPGNDPRDALPHIAFTVPWNMSEHPAASVNWTFSRDGLPIGVQLVGQRFDDLGVLRLSRLIENLRPPQRPYPEPPDTSTDRTSPDGRTAASTTGTDRSR
jgi:Asp-tRNA(Asn)/Glu-tRNA(Gln) amidotransferase A subunit family amidase